MAHFYILRTPPLEKNQHQALLNWTHSFFETIYKKISKAFDPKNHDYADLLFINKEDRAKNYTNTDKVIEQSSHFSKYRPLELKRKFIILEDAHQLSKNHSNKLLKSLEEPPEFITYFFLCPQTSSLLDTIESRGLKITIPLENDLSEDISPIFVNNLNKQFSHLANTQETFSYFSGSHSMQSFVESFKGKPLDLSLIHI